MPFIRLPDRGVLRIEGADAPAFLQGLLTNDVESLASGEARFAALLSPQGKVIADMFAVRTEAGFLVDCPGPQAADLAKRLGFYKLRAKVSVANASAELGVAAAVDGGEAPAGTLAAFADPRASGMGSRVIAPHAALAALTDDARAYDSRRIALGVPQGGDDFAYGDIFPHDASMDLLNGVDFGKGCYVGQEVVSRMKHKGGVKKRVVRLSVGAAAQGTPVMDGALALGNLGRPVGGEALAILRIDRLDEARAAGRALQAGGAPVDAIADVAGRL